MSVPYKIFSYEINCHIFRQNTIKHLRCPEEVVQDLIDISLSFLPKEDSTKLNMHLR